MHRTLPLALLALLAPAFALADDLGPGSPAPKLELKRWLKGQPLSSLPEKGVAVVEFWATWCGPCVQTIPHLTELAHKNKEVTFLGVSIWEDDTPELDKFVNEMGPKMDYRVAYSGNQDGMTKSWMEAALQQGIPTAFLLKDGVVQWIGHPSDLDQPLQQVVQGTFDLAAAKKSFQSGSEDAKAEARFRDELAAADRAFDEGRRDEARAQLKAIEKEHPGLPVYDDLRLVWSAVGDPDRFYRSVERSLKSGGSRAASEAASKASRLSAYPKAVTHARRVITLAAKATKGKNLEVLFVGIALHQEGGDQKGAADIASLGLKALKSKRDKKSAVRRAALREVVAGRPLDGQRLMEGRAG